MDFLFLKKQYINTSLHRVLIKLCATVKIKITLILVTLSRLEIIALKNEAIPAL